jgi:hypothetical protein
MVILARLDNSLMKSVLLGSERPKSGSKERPIVLFCSYAATFVSIVFSSLFLL